MPTEPARVMRRQRDLYAVVHIRPLGMMIGFLREQRHPRHERKSRAEIGELETAVDRQPIFAQCPAGQLGQRRGKLVCRQGGNRHALSLWLSLAAMANLGSPPSFP